VLDGVSNYLNFAVAESGIYFVPLQKPTSIQFLSFGGTQILQVASFDRPVHSTGGGGLALSPDGRWLLFTQLDQAGSELLVVENFR
jgi:hypothetical protein